MTRKSNKRALTDAYLRKLKPTGRRQEIGDTKAPGLYVRVPATNEEAEAVMAVLLAWSIRYRPKGRKQKRAAYGTYPNTPLAEARQRAKEINAAAGRGIDLPAKEAAERRAAESAGRTLASAAREYVSTYCKVEMRRWRDVERLLENHVIPALGSKPLPAVERSHIAELLDDLRTKKSLGVQVNKVRDRLVSFFGWAIERKLVEHNPAATVKRRKGLEKSRERSLSHAELRAVWNAAAAIPYPGGPLAQTWILTGFRRDEARAGEWPEIDIEQEMLWKLAGSRNKSKRDFELPLSSAMVELLRSLPRRGPYVFSLDGRRPYTSVDLLKKRLDRESGVTNWRLHDLRRTMRSGLAEIGVPEEIAEKTLNHTQSKLVKTYNRHQYAEQMRNAMQRWADHVMAIVSGDRGKVVSLRPGA